MSTDHLDLEIAVNKKPFAVFLNQPNHVYGDRISGGTVDLFYFDNPHDAALCARSDPRGFTIQTSSMIWRATVPSKSN